MSTTNLVVELMVTGVGSVGVFVFAALAIFGYEKLDAKDLLSFQSLIPMLAVTYVLGIVTDRVADAMFGLRWSKNVRKAHFPNDDAYHTDRRTILTGSDQLTAIMKYGRSRIRVMRGWTINSFLLGVFGALFALIRCDEIRYRLALFSFISGILLSVGCWYAWYVLSNSEYRKIKEAAAFLRLHDTPPQPPHDQPSGHTPT